MSRPAVIFGGPSPEHDISILTGLLSARALTAAGSEVHCLYWSKTAEWYAVDADLEGEAFVEGVPRRARPLRLLAEPGGGFVGDGGLLRKERPLAISAAVNCCHGAPGEDGTLQGALDLAGIPYAGPSVAGAALGMDKLAFGAVVVAAGLPSLPRVLGRDSPLWAPPFAGPYIVKPRFGGSSIGIAVAADAGAVDGLLRNSVHLGAGAVIEPYRAQAEEVQIAVRAWPEVRLSNLLRPKRRAGGAEFYTYGEKYVPGEGMHAAEGEIDPELADGVAASLREAAVVLASAARVRGVARLDFLVEGTDWYVNEINTIPGSMAKHLWVDPKVPIQELLAGLLDEAVARPTTGHWTTAGADGSALRSAGSINGKLG
jgi:D-alanine-D-alanine ligase